MMEVNTDIISSAALEKMANSRILFAHMSVGRNVLQGIRELQQADPRFEKIRITPYETGVDTSAPGLYHFLVGNNSFPEKKISVCRKMLIDGETGPGFNAFIFKYCYVDFKKETDVEAVFMDYLKLVEEIKSRYPDVKVVHVTVPLTVRYKGLKGWLKFHLFGDHPNEKRSMFNRRLKETFGDNDLIFDLAGIESTDRAGKELKYMSKGQKVNYMAGEWTDDGGHLNMPARKRAALKFMETLARLTENGG